MLKDFLKKEDEGGEKGIGRGGEGKRWEGEEEEMNNKMAVN